MACGDPRDCVPMTAHPETVMAYLSMNQYRGPFKPVPRYSAIGDMLEIHFEDEPAYAEPVNESLTLLRAFSDKRIVGVKVFGVANLVREEGNV